jgi:hypothetical protein
VTVFFVYTGIEAAAGAWAYIDIKKKVFWRAALGAALVLSIVNCSFALEGKRFSRCIRWRMNH